MPHVSLKMLPNWPKMPQVAPKMAQDAAEMAQDGPKMPPETPEMGPKWPQEAPQIAPDLAFQGFPTSKPKNGVPTPISNAALGRFWGPLGAHVGPMLELMRALKPS